ncbi:MULTISPECIES: hypothetical protein [Alcanivorax]|jgi:hypothetical protein|uniref:hypothetical protein n=1 Tax=Alcanivorax TaxID=59753 RepID=UPI002353945D|nr:MULTISPECIES: hypothetical protein [Alcanivorax]MDF1636372.1 hypothetical protein [Alcanivorax jadensis]|tara:strand:- start:22587 stop:22754 length:168 start_codon:yes stop_codon:yes gene_type:complete
MESISSPKVKQDTSKQLNPLTQSEIESLRQEMQQDIEWGLEQLRQRKAQKAEKQE